MSNGQKYGTSDGTFMAFKPWKPPSAELTLRGKKYEISKEGEGFFFTVIAFALLNSGNEGIEETFREANIIMKDIHGKQIWPPETLAEELADMVEEK